MSAITSSRSAPAKSETASARESAAVRTAASASADAQLPCAPMPPRTFGGRNSARRSISIGSARCSSSTATQSISSCACLYPRSASGSVQLSSSACSASAAPSAAAMNASASGATSFGSTQGSAARWPCRISASWRMCVVENPRRTARASASPGACSTSSSHVSYTSEKSTLAATSSSTRRPGSTGDSTGRSRSRLVARAWIVSILCVTRRTRHGGSIGWIAGSLAERDEALALLEDAGPGEPRDELGIGPLRDVLANAFFPGITTLQTRAKYFLFVPTVYARVEADAAMRRRPRESILELEDALLQRLLGFKDRDGVIGSRFERVPETTSSAIYWSGLQTWRIRRFSDSRARYHGYLRTPSRLLIHEHDARTAATATPTPTCPRSGDRRGCAGACAVTLPGPSVPVRVTPPAPLVVPAPAPGRERPGVPEPAQPSPPA